MALLTVENIKKSFGKTEVLKGISFSLNKGEVLAIIGSSGSGKTTLLRCLNFLELPDEGTITVGDQLLIDGSDAATLSDEAIRQNRLHFGLVFQNFNLFPQYSVLQNVTLAPTLLKKGTAEQIDSKARFLLEKVGLSDKLDNYPYQLSGGQQQRVAIARALALSPEVLCFDEPTSALDPELTGEVLRVIRGLKDKDTTMIVVTHEMEFARNVADTVIYMADGVIEEMGTPEEVFDHPQSEKTRAFPTAPEIIQAIVERTEHGIFGYTEPGPGYFAALDAWCHERYGWHVVEEQVTVTPGVVYALATAVRAFTASGDAVVIQQPVYYPFTGIVEANGRTVANAPLSFDGERYFIDFDAFERTIAESGAKLFLLCNPHNPAGRAWTADELAQLAEICTRHETLVVSDEIHMDFARPGHKHISFATVSTAAGEPDGQFIICTSASKTFNLAGLQVANIVIPDAGLRQTFRAEVNASGYSQPNTLGLVATQAAYEHGGSWLDELKDYLEGNWTLLATTLRDRAPALHLIDAESTYLAWIDCRALGLDATALERFVEDEAGLWLDCGHIFGKTGEGFIRINIATQRAYLARALDQLCAAVEQRA